MLKIQEIPIKDLHIDSEFNCRGSIKAIDVVDLAKSITQDGLQQPITVRPCTIPGFKYSVVAGFRRTTAYKEILKRETIPAIVQEDLTEGKARILNLVENLNRKDLNISQEAAAVKKLEEAGYSQTQIAEELNQSKSWVQVRKSLINLPPEIQQAAAAGILNQYQIKDLVSLPTERQFEQVRRIKDLKAKGIKNVKVAKKRVSYGKKLRDRTDIFKMMDMISKTTGFNFATRVLAWCAGEIADYEIYEDIRQEAEKQNKKWIVPQITVSEMEAVG